MKFNPSHRRARQIVAARDRAQRKRSAQRIDALIRGYMEEINHPEPFWKKWFR